MAREDHESPIEYLIELGEMTVAKIDDLNAVVADVVAEQAAVDAAVSDLVAAVTASASANDPAIQTAIDALTTLKGQQAADAAQDPGAPAQPTP